MRTQRERRPLSIRSIRQIDSIAKQGRVYDAVVSDSLLFSAENFHAYRWAIDRGGEVVEGAHELPRGGPRSFRTAALDDQSGRIFLGYNSFNVGDTIAIMELWGDTLIRVGEIEESALSGLWFHEGILYTRSSRVSAYDLRDFPEIRYLNTYYDSWGKDLAVTPGDSIDAMYMVGDELFDGDVSIVSLHRDSGEMQLHEKISVDYSSSAVASSASTLAISNSSGYIYIYTLEDRFSPTFRFRFEASPKPGAWVDNLQIAGGVLLATRDKFYAPYDSLLAYELRPDRLQPIASWPLNYPPARLDAKLLSDGTIRAAVALLGAGILDVRLSRDQLVTRQPQLQSRRLDEVVLPRGVLRRRHLRHGVLQHRGRLAGSRQHRFRSDLHERPLHALPSRPRFPLHRHGRSGGLR